jgi:hypothetical protein
MDATEIRELLRKEICEVRFTKKDKSERKMFCTLNPEYLPESQTTVTPTTSDTIITVWDLEVNGWRSFRLDSLIDIEAGE